MFITNLRWPLRRVALAIARNIRREAVTKPRRGAGACLILAALFAGLTQISCSTVDDGPSDALMDRLVQARELLARGQSRATVELLLPLRPALRTDEQRAAQAALLGEAYYGLGDHRRCLEELARADVANRDRDRELAFRIALLSGRAANARSEWASAEAFLLRAVELASASDDRDAALVLAAEAALRQSRPVIARERLSRVRNSATAGHGELATLLAAGAESTSDVPTDSQAKVPAPHVRPRQDWRAKPMNMAAAPMPMSRPWRVTIHHSGDRGAAPRTLEAVIRRLQGYQATHQLHEGWADIGYHFIIDAEARIWEGRGLEWQGAHAGSDDANAGNIGICVMGNFERDEPEIGQRSALRVLLAWLLSMNGIQATAVLTHDEVLRQYQDGDSECPGIHLRRVVVAMRADLAR